MLYMLYDTIHYKYYNKKESTFLFILYRFFKPRLWLHPIRNVISINKNLSPFILLEKTENHFEFL